MTTGRKILAVIGLLILAVGVGAWRGWRKQQQPEPALERTFQGVQAAKATPLQVPRVDVPAGVDTVPATADRVPGLLQVLVKQVTAEGDGQATLRFDGDGGLVLHGTGQPARAFRVVECPGSELVILAWTRVDGAGLLQGVRCHP
jgi:hypothetical protein